LSVLDAWASNCMSRCAGMLAPDWRARKPFRAARSRAGLFNFDPGCCPSSASR
jgi:hypothetical protein